jgi:hypothetical protein
MMTRTLKMAAIAVAFAAAPMIGAAANEPTALNGCVKAFMADLSSKAPNTLKLVETHYRNDMSTPDDNFEVLAGSSSLTLTARDAHDNRAVARVVCTVNSQGGVLGMRAAPLGFEPF